MTRTLNQSDTVYASHGDVEAFVVRMLTANGISDPHAKIVAGCLVQADLRGVQTHGIARLPAYLARLERDMVNPAPQMKLEKKTPVAASLDGDNGFGFIVGRTAMAAAIEMAAEYGVGIVAARHSNHFGMAASYLLQAVEAGYMAFVFTNASRAMPPWGGRKALLGTSPFAAAAPSGNEVPFVLDMSPAVAARGKIRQAERRGDSIPEGYALDAEGHSTTDPSEAMKGVVLPIGGAKGSGIAMLMDIMSGVLSGAAFGGDVTDQYSNFDEPQNVGHFFMVLKPGLFITDAEFRQRMDVLVGRVHDSPRAAGFDEVLMPGEIEARLEAERRRTGIPFAMSEITLLNEAADKISQERLVVSLSQLS